MGVACGGPRESSRQSSPSPEARPCLVSNTEEGALEAEVLAVRWGLRVQSAVHAWGRMVSGVCPLMEDDGNCPSFA